MSRLSPVNFWRHSEAFLGAAEREFKESGIGLSIPAYFLIGRSLELGLKSFLLLHGSTEAGLRKVGHDLQTGLKAAQELGIDEVVEITAQDVAAIEMLNPYYVSKDLEYTKTGYKSYPEPEYLLAAAKKLLQGVEPGIRAWRPE